MSTEPGSFSSNGSMIVVSNRLPFVLKRNEVTGQLERKASAGGLVTAVAPVVISGNGVWVGWPGMHMENPNEPIPESDPNDRTPTAGLLSRKVMAVHFDPVIFDAYYNGCCNGTFGHCSTPCLIERPLSRNIGERTPRSTRNSLLKRSVHWNKFTRNRRINRMARLWSGCTTIT